MATRAGAGAGGKLRTKIPLRPVTPYTRRSATTTTVTKQHPSILKRLLDSASSLVYAGASSFLHVFFPRPPVSKQPHQNVVRKERQSGNAAAPGIAELKQMLEQKTFTRSEIERLTSLLLSKTTNSPSDELPEHGDKTLHAAAVTSTPIVVTSRVLKRKSSVLYDDIGSGTSLRRIRQKANLLSQRQKKDLGYPVFQQQDVAVPNLLLTNRPTTKVPDYASVPLKSTQTATKILQHLDNPSQRPGTIERGSVSTLEGIREKSPNKLKIDTLHGQALKSMEKADSPKCLPSYHDIQKQVESELSFQRKNETDESSLKNLPAPQNINGDVTVTDTFKEFSCTSAVEITDLPLKATIEPQMKHAFLMSAPEGSFETDDEEDGVHDNGHALSPLVEDNKPTTSKADIIKTPTSPEVSGIPKLVETNKPMFHEVLNLPEQVKLRDDENNTATPKTEFGSFGGSVSEPGLGFKTPVSSPTSSSVTTPQTSVFTPSTLQMDKTEAVKISPPLFSANEYLETKPNASSDPKENRSISEFTSGSTSSIFCSTWQQPKPYGFGSAFSPPSPSVFTFWPSSTQAPSFMTASTSNSSFRAPSVFANSNPFFGAITTSPNNNTHRMSMEDDDEDVRNRKAKKQRVN